MYSIIIKWVYTRHDWKTEKVWDNFSLEISKKYEFNDILIDNIKFQIIQFYNQLLNSLVNFILTKSCTVFREKCIYTNKSW